VGLGQAVFQFDDAEQTEPGAKRMAAWFGQARSGQRHGDDGYFQAGERDATRMGPAMACIPDTFGYAEAPSTRPFAYSASSSSMPTA